MAVLSIVKSGEIVEKLDLANLDALVKLAAEKGASFHLEVAQDEDISLFLEGEDLVVEKSGQHLLTVQNYQLLGGESFYLVQDGQAFMLTDAALSEVPTSVAHLLATALSDASVGAVAISPLLPLGVLGAAGVAMAASSGSDDDSPKVTIEGEISSKVVEDNPEGIVVEGMLEVKVQEGLEAPTLEDVNLEGRYGSFILKEGKWTYTLDNAKAQSLGEGETAKEEFTVKASDGTSHKVDIEVSGVDDAAVVTGVDQGTVKDGSDNTTVKGSLTISDADANDDPKFIDGDFDGDYGSLSFTGGKWTYTLDSDRPATQALNAGERVTESFTVTADDGSSQQITIDVVADDNYHPVEPDYRSIKPDPTGRKGAWEIHPEHGIEASLSSIWNGDQATVLTSGSTKPFKQGSDVLVLKFIGDNFTVQTYRAADRQDGHDSITLIEGMKGNAHLQTALGNDFLLMKNEADNHGLRDTARAELGDGYDYAVLGHVAPDASLDMGSESDAILFIDDLSQLQGKIDGGEGFDQFIVGVAGEHDLANIIGEAGNMHLNNIELFDMRNDGSDTLVINDEVLAQINGQLIDSSIDIDALVAEASGSIHVNSPLSNILHVAGDEGDIVDLMNHQDWVKTDITHNLDDVWFRSANEEGNYTHIEEVPMGDSIDHAKPTTAEGNFTLYRYSYDGINDYVFIQDGINII